MIVGVNLGTAIDFSSYDVGRNLIRVHATELKKEHLGVHTVSVTATMAKDTYSKKKFENTFLITVLPRNGDLTTDQD